MDGVALRTDTLSDAERLEALRSVSLLDSAAEPSFDRLTRLAVSTLNAPVALIALVDEDRQFFKSCVGLPEPWASQRETPLSHSFCQHTVITGEPLVIEDARDHPLVRDNLAIRDLGVVAYAGMPLRSSDGFVLGSFCIIDRQPRVWTATELAILADLAAIAMSEIELRTATQLAHGLEEERDRLQVRERAALTRAETSEVTLAAVIEHVPTGLVVVDADGRMVLINEVGRAISGAPPEPGLPLAEQAAFYQICDSSTGLPMQPEQTPIARALAGMVVVNDDGVFRRPGDGEDTWVRQSAVPLLDSEGRITGAVAIFSDITPERTLERQKEDFLAAVTHDLKTPLTTIKGFTQMLQRRVTRGGVLDPQQIISALTHIDGTATRMVGLIDELMEITRIQLGESLTLHRAPSDLVTLAEHVVNQHRDLTANHNVTVDARSDPVMGDWDAGRIDRVLANLLVNAIKYSPDGGHVAVTVDRERTGTGWRAVLVIADDGIGIPESDLPFVFEPLYRGSNVTDALSGTGIGLASARQIVEQHGGTITVQSREGEGTAFTVHLPAWGPESA